MGRRLNEQREAANEVDPTTTGAVPPGLLINPTDRPLINPGPGAKAATDQPLINPGVPQAKAQAPLINPGEPHTKEQGPLINPGEPQTKIQGPLINPGEAPSPLPGNTTIAGNPGVLDVALQALSAQDQVNNVNTLALAARQAVGRAPEGGVVPIQAVADPVGEAVAPAHDAEALLTADAEAVGPATPNSSGASSATAQAPGAGADTSVQSATQRDVRPDLDLARVDDAGADTQDAALEPQARPVPAEPVAPSVVTRADVPVARLSMDAVAQLSAQIIRRLEGRATRFDIELNPVELGRVDVRLDIDAEGRLAARLAFDNPAAAVELRGRVDELRRDLQQAGFQLADDAFSFADRGGSGRDQASHGDDARRLHARSAELAAEIDAAAQPALRTMTRLGLDVRV